MNKIIITIESLLTKASKAYFLLLTRAKLKIYGVHYGKQMRGNRVKIKNLGSISLGNSVSLNSFPDGELSITGLLTHCSEAGISIGSHCNLNGTMIHCLSSVTIGDYCLFGPGTKIVDNDSHRIAIQIDERRKKPRTEPIIIHDNVWVGMNSLILKGVTIGANAIVAAHSVVTKDVPANTLVAGNPAEVRKKLMP